MILAEELIDEFYYFFKSRCDSGEFISSLADKIYSFIKYEIKDCYKEYHSKEIFTFPDVKSKIEICKKNLYKIIKLFEETDDKGKKFMSKFPKWQKLRERNIELLNKIADDLHDERKVINAVNTISSVVGLAGGAAILGSIFFPPASIVTLPAWLGGSTVAALLPSCILGVVGTTTAATSSLAVAGGAAVVANGASKIVASVTELKLLKEHMDDAQSILSKDEELFEELKDWLTHTDNFVDASNEIFGFNIFDYLVEDVVKFLRFVKKVRSRLEIFNKLRNLFHKYIPKLIKSGIPLKYCIALFGILFLSFLIYQDNRVLFYPIVATHCLITGNLVLLNSVNAVTAVSTTSTITCAEAASKVLARNVTLGVFTGAGMALDLIIVVKNSIEMIEGSKSEYGEGIEKISKKLKDELDVLSKVYKELQHSMLRALLYECSNKYLATGAKAAPRVL